MRAVRGIKNNVPLSGPGVKQQATAHRFDQSIDAAGNVNYVGLTKDIERRAAEQP